MDAQTVRTALGTIQSNPTEESAWQSLADAIGESGGDLEKPEALALLRAACNRHRARGESEAVARLLTLGLKTVAGGADEVALTEELAKVLLEELFDGPAALQLLRSAVERMGDEPILKAHLSELEERANSSVEQAATYSAEAENASDDDYRSAMLMRSAEAEICFAKNPAYSKIIENLEASLRLDSGNDPTTRLLEVIYRRQNDFEGLIRVLERASDRSPHHDARVAAGVRLARLHQHHFGDQAKAAAAYDRVLESEANHADAMAFVTEYYSAEQRWNDLVRVYEHSLKEADDDAAHLGEMLQVAMLHWKMRGSPAEAEPWFEKIALLEPAHDGVLNFYREYKTELHDDAALVRVLEAARKALPDDDERVADLDEELEEKQGEQVGAQKLIEKFKNTLRVDPENEEARAKLKDLYKQTQGHNALVELLRQDLDRLPEDAIDERLSVMREVASVYRIYVKSDTALVGVLNQIVQLDGKLDERDVVEVRELVGLYEKLNRPRDHLASLKLLAELVSDRDEKIGLYRQVGRCWLDQFSNVQHAMEAFAALHALEPDDPEANERLEDLYRKRRSWKELFALYQERLSSAKGDARVPLLREMGQLAAERLNKVKVALDFYREILDIDPSRADVLDRMEKYAERSKDWSTLADVLERRMAVLTDENERLAVLQKLGTVYAEHLDKAEEAIGAWRRVVEVQPGHPRAMRVLRDAYLKGSRFDDLEELYTEQKELEGLAEVFSTAADRSRNAEEKLDLSYRAARVYEEGLGQAARAIRSYERILSIDAKDKRAIARLLPLYEQEEKWGRIPPLLEVQIELSTDDEARIELFSQVVDVAGNKLADKKGAVAYARRAFEIAPENPRALELLDSAVRAAGSWEEMLGALEARLGQIGGDITRPSAPPTAPAKKKRRSRKPKKGASVEPTQPEAVEPPPEEVSAEQRAVALRLCRVLGEELGRVDEAVVRLRALTAHAPQDEEIMSTLETLLRRDCRPEDMRWLFEHQRSHASGKAKQAEILCQWAVFEETKAGNLDAALTRYDESLKLRPKHVPTLEAIVRIALAQGHSERAVEALTQHRDLLGGQDAAAKDALIAELLADRLNKPAQALEAARRALAGGAEPGAVIPVLQRLVEIAEVRADAAEILSEQYELGGDSRQEADAVRALISETKDRDKKVELFKKLADIFEYKLGETGAALSVIVEALSAHPEEGELWDRAGPLAGISGRPTDLAEAFRTALRTELPLDLTLDLARRAALLHETTLEDPQGAVPYYEKILVLEPDDTDAFLRLREVLTSGERWRELEELYDAEIQRLGDDPRGVDILAEVALLAEDIMGDTERAIGYHKRILDIDSETAVSLEALDRLYTRADMKAELLLILQRRAELAVGEARHAHLVRVAQVAITQHVPDQAVAAVEEVLGDDPNHYESRDIAEELLLIGSVKGRAARALESVYEMKDEIRDLVRVLGVRVESLRPQDGADLSASEVSERENERRDLLRRIATLRDDRLHDDEGSFDVFAELSPLDPEDSELRERLIDSGRRLGRGKKVVEVLLAGAKSAPAPEVRAEILLQAASVQGDLLEDNEAAARTLSEVIELKTEVPEAALKAARALEPLLLSVDSYQKLADNLSVQIELEDDFEHKAELLARLARLQSDNLGSPEAAIDAWEQRLSDNADDAEALRNLTELYEKAERYDEVARVLMRRREGSSDDQERANLARHLADVQEQHLGDTHNAIESYRAILDESGPNPEVFAALVRLYQGAERWDDLADIFERQAESLELESDRLGALAALGRLRSDQQKDIPGALEAYRRALALDVGHASSREALLSLLKHEDSQARMEVAQILEPIFESEANHSRLLSVVVVQAESADDPSEKAARYLDAVRITESALGDPDKAMELAATGARAAAGQTEMEPWVTALERLAGVTNSRGLQVAVLSDVVGEIFDSELQVRVQRRIAELKRNELGDAPGAIESYQKVIELQSDDQESLLALERLFGEIEDWSALLGVLDAQLEAAAHDQVRKEIAFKRASLLSEKLNNDASAIEAYEQILEFELDLQAIGALENLYAKSERFDDLASLIQRRIDVAGPHTAGLRVELARVAAGKQDDVERGLDELSQALEEDSQHQGAVSYLEELRKTVQDPQLLGRLAALLEPVYMVRADYDKVLEALSLRLAGSEEPDERRELVTRIAQIHEEQREDYGAALEVTAKLLSDDLGDLGTLEEMERLAKVAGAEERLAELYAVRVQAVDIDDEASAQLCRRSGIIFARLGRAEALPLLRRALAIDPESEELFSAIDALLEKANDAAARVELHRNALEHRYEPEAQKRLLGVIARLEEESLGDVDAAILAHRQARDVDAESEESFAALARLYHQTENWTDLGDLYLSKAESLDPSDGAEFRILLADLYMRKLGRHEPALEQLEEIVSAQPEHPGALERLEAMRASEELRGRVVDLLRPLYQSQDNWRSLIRLNEDRFELAIDPMDRVMILKETGELWESRGDDLGRAAQAFASAWRLAPEDEELRSEVERLAHIREDWTGLGALYTELLDANPDMLGRREVLAHLAEICDARLEDPRSALIRTMELSDLDESDPEPLDSALRLSLLLGDWKVCEAVLGRKVEAVYDDTERADLLMRLGELRHLTLDNVEGALQAYEQSFEVDQSNAIVCDRLIALYEDRDDSARLVDLYTARIEGDQASDELKFQLLARSAQLFESKLDDASRAIDALNQALSIRSGDSTTVLELNRLYKKEERWSELLDNLRLEAGTAATAEHRLKVRFSIAQILAEKMQSSEEALETYGVILDERPDDEVALDAVFALVERERHLAREAANLLIPALRQTSLRKKLVRALSLRLSEEENPHQRVETLRTMAQVQEDDLQDPKGAFESFLSAIKDTPEANDLYDEVGRLAALVDGWKRFAQVLRERATETFDSEVACALWIRLAEVLDQRLKDKKGAIEAYQMACDQVGDRLDLLDALDRILSELGNTDAVVALLERRMSLAESDEDHARLYCRQGQLQLDKRKDPVEAISSFRQALERDLHSTEASEFLEGLLSKDEFFEEVFNILSDVYRERPDGPRLAKLHDLRVKRASSPEDRLEMRRELSRVLEDECRGNLAAQSVLEEALLDDINDGGLRDDLARLCAKTGAWSEAGVALVKAVNGTQGIDADLAVELCLQAAEWQRDRGLDPDQAEVSLLVAHRFAPDNDEILSQLEALQNTEGKEDLLLVTLRKRAHLSDDPEVQLELLRRGVELSKALADSGGVEECLREILDVKGDDKEALDALIELRRKSGAYAEAHELLGRRIDAEENEAQLRELRFGAAEISRDHLNDLEKATAIFKQLFDEEPGEARAINALRQAYLEGKRYEELGQLITTLMETSSDLTIKADLKVGLAQLRFEQFNDVEKAVELLEEVFTLDPQHQDAARVLAQVYEASSRFVDLAGLLRRRAELKLSEEDQSGALELLNEAAATLEQKAKDFDAALAIWSKIRELRDESEVREKILSLQLSAGNRAEAALLLEQICEGLSGDEQLKRRTELAEIYRELGDKEALVRTLEGSLALNPGNVQFRQVLRREYETAEVWSKVAEMVLQDAEHSEGVTKIDLLREAAVLYEKKCNDVSTAAEVLKKAADLAPNDRDLLLELCDAYSASGRGADAAAVLEKVVESYGGKRSKELGEIHRRLATAYLSLQEKEKALAELDKAFRIEPGNVHVLKQLGEVAMVTGDLKKAQQMFRALLLQRLEKSSPITKAEVFCKLGQVHQMLGETPKAKQMFERALQTDADLTAAQEGLASL